jgi:polyisoprenoid-binding protein YceI
MATYKIDSSHSEITFKVKHLMITTVTGSFTQFDATLESEKEDLSDAKVIFEAETASVNTNNEQRDAHLKSDDFFNAERFPKITFRSTAIKKTGEDEYKLTGDLTIRDITKPLTVNVVYGGQIVDPYGQTKAGFEIDGKINRKEYGLKWNALTETGGFVVSDDVRLIMNVQMVKQAKEVEAEVMA